MAFDDKTDRTDVPAVPLYQQVMDDLKGEIARGAWLPLPLDERILFATDPAARWERMFEMLGVTALGAISMRTIGSA